MVGDTARGIIAAPDQRVADALQEVQAASCLYLLHSPLKCFWTPEVTKRFQKLPGDKIKGCGNGGAIPKTGGGLGDEFALLS